MRQSYMSKGAEKKPRAALQRHRHCRDALNSSPVAGETGESAAGNRLTTRTLRMTFQRMSLINMKADDDYRDVVWPMCQPEPLTGLSR